AQASGGPSKGIADGDFYISLTQGDEFRVANDEDESSDTEVFYDSDYDFNDDLIYEKYIDVNVNDNGKVLAKSIYVSKRKSSPKHHGPHSDMDSSEGERSETLNNDMHIYDGQNINVGEESKSVASDELLSLSSSLVKKQARRK
ncbi:hypothetical protein ACH5RR_031974, partial [Cinchona calisaya]